RRRGRHPLPTRGHGRAGAGDRAARSRTRMADARGATGSRGAIVRPLRSDIARGAAVTSAPTSLAAPTVATRRPRSVANNASLAFTGDATTKVAGLIAIVALARILPTAEMARYGVALAAATILTTVLDAGGSTVIVRDGASDPHGSGKATLGSV